MTPPTPIGAHPPRTDAVRRLDSAIRTDPANADLYLQRAELRRIDQHWSLALADLDTVVSLESERAAEVDFYRARVQFDRGDFEVSRRLLDSFFEGATKSTRSQGLIPLALTLRAAALEALDMRREAVTDLDLAIQLSPRPGPGLYLTRARLVADPDIGEQGKHNNPSRSQLLAALESLDEGLARLSGERGPVTSLQRAAISLELRLGRRDAALARIDSLAPSATRMPRNHWRDLFPHVTILETAPASTQELAPSLTRGPYLQLATPTSVVVRWRTATASDTRVSFGLTLPGLDTTVSDSDLATDHEMLLSGLTPDAVYYYSIGTSSSILAGGDTLHSFRSPPAAGQEKPTRLWVIGDSGSASDAARAVRDAYLAFTGNRRTDVWLMLGDNAYTMGTDEEYQAALFDLYANLLRQSFLWPTFGNHEALSANSSTQSGPYYQIFTLPTGAEAGGLPSGTEAYYSFDYGNIHFVSLDSSDTALCGDPTNTDCHMFTWMRDDLDATSRDWIIAYWHHPPYSKGSHDSDSENRLRLMREIFVPELERHGVDLVLTGHSHSYERSFLLAGHYGTSETLDPPTMILDGGDGHVDGQGAYHKPSTDPTGAVFVVAGSSGKITPASLDHPVMFVSLLELGSLVVDIDGLRLDATFLRDDGSIRDQFTLIKDSSVSEIFSDGFEGGGVSSWSAAVP